MVTSNDLRTTSILSLEFGQIETIGTSDIIQYLSFCEDEGDKAATRGLKLAAIRKFFDYYTKIAKRLVENPAEVIPSPSVASKLPVYLSEEECLSLLAAIDGPEAERNYCIMTILMNCDLRLSELVNLDLSNIQGNGLIKVTGKGQKERLLFLNEACQASLRDYLETRDLSLESHEDAPLFISKRTGHRITGRRVQQIMQELLLKAGLSGRGYSPHKLRHPNVKPKTQIIRNIF